jgi:hypothetical protein
LSISHPKYSVRHSGRGLPSHGARNRSWAYESRADNSQARLGLIAPRPGPTRTDAELEAPGRPVRSAPPPFHVDTSSTDSEESESVTPSRTDSDLLGERTADEGPPPPPPPLPWLGEPPLPLRPPAPPPGRTPLPHTQSPPSSLLLRRLLEARGAGDDVLDRGRQELVKRRAVTRGNGSNGGRGWSNSRR